MNKAILAGLSSGQYQTADEVLVAYARRYFRVDADTAKLWAAWLKAWGKPFDVDVERSAATLESLLKKTPQGRLAVAPMGVETAIVRHSQGNRRRRPVDGAAAGGGGALLDRSGTDPAGPLGTGSAAAHFRPAIHALALVSELGEVPGHGGRPNRQGAVVYPGKGL